MKHLPILLLFCLCSSKVYGQRSYTVRGNLTDTSTGTKLMNATIAVLRAKDSVLCGFTWNTNSTAFSVDKLPAGNYLLLVTYPGYADYTSNFRLDSTHADYDFGNITMMLKSKLLSEVIVKGKMAEVQMNGDTTEYNAAAFTTDVNAKVEDLLRQFPGISVDENGQITAQGKTVTRVLVDGDEFFGDDPTLVTKNIRADMVDKVQLYDRKSDRAVLTGVDDGKKEKTLNIKLREDKKYGQFGKANAGAGAGDAPYYSAEGMYNTFANKRRASVFGDLDNTGKIGISWSDNDKYGMVDDMVGIVQNGQMIYDPGDDDLEYNGNYSGQGKPLAKLGGVHYDDKFPDDKGKVSVNYKIGSLAVDGGSNTVTENNIPRASINSNTDDQFHKYIFRQKLTGSMQLKIDSTSLVKFSVAGTLKNTNNTDVYNASSRREDSTLLNGSQRAIDNKSNTQSFTVRGLYSKKFKKPGRSLNISAGELYSHDDASGTLKTITDYYDETGTLSGADRINQLKHNNSRNNGFSAGVLYTEPVTKNGKISLSYGIWTGSNTANRQTFDSSAEGKYTHLDSTYSSNFTLNNLSNDVSADYNFKTKKSAFGFGASLNETSYNEINQYNDSSFKRSFTNLSPHANYEYQFPTGDLSASYSYGNQLPDMNQLQPLANNTDPLNIQLGNPGLKPSHRHSFGFMVNSNKPVTGHMVWMDASYGLITSPVVTNKVTDSTTGKSTYQAANINQTTSDLFFTSSYYSNIGKTGVRMGLGVSLSGNTMFNMVNGVLNKTTTYDPTFRISFSKYKAKKYAFNLLFLPTYDLRKVSLEKNNYNSFDLSINESTTLYLPGRFQFGTQGSYLYKGATQGLKSYDRVNLSSSLSRTFTKSQSLRVMAVVEDIFNQNNGFSRTVTANVITQNMFTTIKRYFVLRVFWDFSRMHGNNDQN
jgi:hypothetical protein